MDELVEKLAAVIGELLGDSEFDPKYYARAVLARIEAEGMVIIVPAKATKEMLAAALDYPGMSKSAAEQVWMYMLAAAPKPPTPSATGK